jgi:hypothetical protein
MLKKENIKWSAISLYLLSFLCLFIDFEFNRKTIIALIIGGVATLASIIALFIPTNYTFFFEKETWLSSNNGDFDILIPYKNHAQSKSSQISVYIKTELGNFELIEVAIKQDNEGNINLSANNAFKGKVIVTG